MCAGAHFATETSSGETIARARIVDLNVLFSHRSRVDRGLMTVRSNKLTGGGNIFSRARCGTGYLGALSINAY
jgi:hypothetical protein